MATITIGSATDPGKRETNEDSVLAVLAQEPGSRRRAGQPASGATALLILADGMGGRIGGQLASQTAVKTTYRELAHILAMRSDVDSAYLETALHNALRQANSRIQELVTGNPAAAGMGTTCTVAIVARGHIAVAHVGDTRAYLLCDHIDDRDIADDGLQLLTEDHSVVAAEVREGRLTQEEARRSRFRNVITRAVGVEASVTPDISSRDIESGTLTHLVISTDGLHGSVTGDEIDSIVHRYSDSPQEAADALVEAAKVAGATDNISAIVARIDASFDEPGYANGASDEWSPDDSISGPTARKRARSWLGNSAAFLAGAVLVGAATWFGGAGRHALLSAGIATTVPVSKPAAPGPPAAVDLKDATYGSPISLLGRSVSGKVLLRAADDLLVVDPAAQRVLRVRTSDGNVVTSSPDLANLAGAPQRSSYWTADAQGDLYQAQPSPPSLRKFDPDGHFLRTIAQGVLTAPASVAVAGNGDVFVVDNGTLKRIPAAPAPPGSSVPPPTSPASAAPRSNT